MKVFISKYGNIISHYFEYIENAEIIEKIPNSTYIVCIGLNIIIYVFKMAYYHSKNIDYAYEHTQKACYRFLEYIEQMHQTNTLHNLNNVDAVLFIYKNTIDDLNTPMNHSFHSTCNSNLEIWMDPNRVPYPSSSSVQSLAPQSHPIHAPHSIHMFQYECKIIQTITHATKVLICYKNEFYFEDDSSDSKRDQPNTIDNMIYISKYYLPKFLAAMDFPEINDLSSNVGGGGGGGDLGIGLRKISVYNCFFYYIKLIQEKIDFTPRLYHLFLQEVLKYLVKWKHANTNTNQIWTELGVQYKYMELFMVEENFKKLLSFLEKDKMKWFVKMLFHVPPVCPI